MLFLWRSLLVCHTCFSRLCELFCPDKFCSKLPSSFSTPCRAFVSIAGHDIAKLLDADLSPERVCVEIGACKSFQQCHLFPQAQFQSPPGPFALSFSTLKWSPWSWLLEEIAKIRTDHIPISDSDGDYFSAHSNTLRGVNWRGRSAPLDASCCPGCPEGVVGPARQWRESCHVFPPFQGLQ